MPAKSRKERAIEFLTLAGSGEVREAYRRHVAPDFKHHNPWFHGDAESLMRGMEENAVANPDKKVEVLRALEDGDYVAVFFRVQHHPGELGAAVVHIARFQGDRIAELWDIGQEVPAGAVNENGMF